MQALILPDPDDPDAFIPPQCFMRADLDPAVPVSRFGKLGYYKLDPKQPLAKVLRATHFVEFPTIDIWEEGEFKGTIVDAQGMITQHAEEERAPKRRKLDAKAGKKAMVGLLGGYGSESEYEDEKKHNALATLGGYAGSDDEEAVAELGIDDMEAGEDEGDEEVEIDAAALIELVKQAQALQGTDDDAVDWGESDSEDVGGNT